MEEKREAYLKCNYSEGMSSKEYFVNFKGSLERGTGLGGNYIVMKDRVIKKNETSGLIPILIARRDEKTSQILIGAMDVGASTFFTVPNEEIVFNKD
ncbi:MAG: hypothetical protein NTZ83_00830 [Candidatus Pacearchaeota archaeon]|nr:hypothetical protein [Candidatus Pacearchaeota archaeon]